MTGQEPRSSGSTPAGRRGRVFALALAAVSLAIVVTAAVLLFTRYLGERSGSVMEDVPRQMTKADPSTAEGGCPSPATEALGMGSTGFDSEEELVAAFGDELLLPDPETLPAGTTFAGGRFSAGMKGSYLQTILGFRLEAPEDVVVEILIFNVGPYDGPVEEHTPVTVRGKSGYLFQSLLGQGAHSVMWREDCRWVTVDARLPTEAVLAIAEGLGPPPSAATSEAGA